MAALPRLCSAILFLLCICLQGGSQAAGAKCSLSSIIIKQAKTGALVEGKPEYEVTMTNACNCPQSKVLVQCYGLSSVLPVNPRSIRAVDDTNCIVKAGQPVVRGAPVKFKYAWMTPQDFPLVSSKISC
ncbi:hypothetical protein Taro_042821 [Colocasia esculenta]|uniref:Uncharacterized protein n=1 Tax=Colocasia esculenta TaxID=4460 RepID=A0A843WHU8_COLES|nr:hypothetical protein [Colocasia esculenta]